MRRTMEWAARGDHLRGVPRKMIITAVGAFAKAVANLLNTTTVYNAETLLRLVRHRPPGLPLITVSNHMSTSVILSCNEAISDIVLCYLLRDEIGFEFCICIVSIE